MLLLLGEDLDRAEHRDRQDRSDEQERYEPSPAREIGVAAGDHERREQRERNEDRRRPRQPELLVRGQGEKHGRNLSWRSAPRWVKLPGGFAPLGLGGSRPCPVATSFRYRRQPLRDR